MIFGINDKIKFSDMKVRMEELESEVKNLKHQISEYDTLIASINSDLTKATPILDFDLMRVFSIERTVSNNKPCTVLGYYINDPIVSADGEMIVDRDKVREWTLYCNNDRHATLVEEFKLWKQQSTRN